AKRLSDTRGFMLGEQLISIVFLGMLCLVVAAGTGAAMSNYTAITQAATCQAVTDDAIARINAELQFAQDPVWDDSLQEWHFTSANRGAVRMRTEYDYLETGTPQGIVLQEKMPVGHDKTIETLAARSGLHVPLGGSIQPLLAGSIQYDPATKLWTYQLVVLKCEPGQWGPAVQTTDVSCLRIGN
ncbi:MAG: hypothetical protein RR477_01455, partial [Raoultibacter sp.]